MNHPAFRRIVSSRTSAVLLTCGLALGFALLIWLKLRVVTGVPRTAYADPESVEPAPREAR
ncbi:MAG: hypothetical protein HBSAPP03_25130 [Phycisphaerae bacterium]|nr:MAG: hypothetical protein HBSAPP03_25130 [Phycisphaerae bacterium]